ncbi:MAG: GNAT family N-acetyltransferase, partial [Geminicoccaceae bacterium]
MAPEIVIRAATLADAPDIARVHVASWQATYTGLLPQAHIDVRSHERRLELWQRNLGGAHRGLIYVAAVHNMVIGFAAAGPARDPSLHCAGELYALYLLAKWQR